MPRYFIDTDDGDHCHRDDEGHDLPDLKSARLQAIDALPDMARDKIPDGDCRTFSVSVRDEGGRELYSACLDLRGAWKVTPPA